MADASLPAMRALSRPGTAMAATMPMMATTTSSSISVNPFAFRVFMSVPVVVKTDLAVHWSNRDATAQPFLMAEGASQGARSCAAPGTRKFLLPMFVGPGRQTLSVVQKLPDPNARVDGDRPGAYAPSHTGCRHLYATSQRLRSRRVRQLRPRRRRAPRHRVPRVGDRVHRQCGDETPRQTQQAGRCLDRPRADAERAGHTRHPRRVARHRAAAGGDFARLPRVGVVPARAAGLSRVRSRTGPRRIADLRGGAGSPRAHGTAG